MLRKRTYCKNVYLFINLLEYEHELEIKHDE